MLCLIVCTFVLLHGKNNKTNRHVILCASPLHQKTLHTHYLLNRKNKIAQRRKKKSHQNLFKLFAKYILQFPDEKISRIIK